MYVLLVAGVTAHFMAYSHLEPFMQRVAGLAGSALFSWQGLRHPAAFLLCALAALAQRLCPGASGRLN
ncbi:hypothetical protein EBQ34_09930 [Vandammella animalimorsus]|uniref:Uncharacterized protein n=1 Tax=Vandammella animalimorsus TaxID=2029117 RepID=A0A3M6R9P6_9BURK|nr:hypothetical protein EBQ34_09930 [Vandammella animalimorsus]